MFVKMLSTRVAEVLVILVGLFISGKQEWANKTGLILGCNEILKLLKVNINSLNDADGGL